MAQRQPLQVRVGEAGLAWLDAVARRTNTSRSVAARAALKIAAQHEKDVEALLRNQL